MGKTIEKFEQKAAGAGGDEYETLVEGVRVGGALIYR